MELNLTFSLLAIALIGCVSAYPRVSRAAAVNQPKSNAISSAESSNVSPKDKNAQTLQYSNEFNPEDNSFVYQYETDNGIKVQGIAKDNKVTIQGSYFLTMPDGSQVPVQYTAGDDGFQVDSAAIPTPHPIIAKMAAYLRTLPPLKEEDEIEVAKSVGSLKAAV